MYDAAIIGAGPAGTAAAYDLLSKGACVLLLDKHEFPRKKACAGGITPKAYDLFRYDIASVVKRECRTLKITPPGLKPFDIKDKKTLCYMTRREELDLLSLQMVVDKGADFRVTNKIRSIREMPSHVEIKADDHCFKASCLIGADGANSVVRRFVIPETVFKKQMALEADVKVARPESFPMEFDFSRSANSYFWIFPRSDHVNIGIYSLETGVKPQRRQLIDYAKERLNTNRLRSIKGYPLCTGGSGAVPGTKRVLLAGDAAGLCERLLGEGIYFAVKSGQDAAWAILESKNRVKSPQSLYQEKLKKIGMDLRIHDLASQLLYRFPKISLKSLGIPFVHRRFARGYARGRTITEILHVSRFF